MCGIAGYTGHHDPTCLERMLGRLVPRGPDEVGHHHEPGITLGVRRLRVIDPEHGQQPIANETGTLWVVLNGEIYNYRELREELIQKGHRFMSHCDTEVLVHLYEQEGEEGVRRLRGMFAYALWDRNRRTLLLVRDRLGIKPLYYATRTDEAEPGGVAFSSDLPSLQEALPPTSILPEAVRQYFTLLYVPGPGTVFQGIQQVRPGELLRIHEGQVQSWRYFDPAHAVEGPAPSDASHAARQFHEVFRDTVRAHLVSDVPLGLFLSGGLDSGAILATMRAVTSGTIRTFSIGYDVKADRSYDELEAARLLADRFGTDHHEERLVPDAVRLLPKIVTAMGEPFADSSAIPTYLVSGMARRAVTVALSGIGGDELFGGYPRYLGLRLAARYASAPESFRQWVATRIAPGLPEGDSSRNPRGRVKRFLRNGHLPLTEQYHKWVTFLPPEWGTSAFTPEFVEATQGGSSDNGYRTLFDSWPSDDPADRAMGLDLQTYLPDDLLRMGDRLSMAHSLELRVPFCDHHLLTLARAIPASMRFSGWKLKGFLREALKSTLPPAILRRPKFGFQVPIARWLREDLREMVQDLLSEEAVRKRGYLKPEYVRWVVRQHDTGARNCSDQLYALLVLELWQRQQTPRAAEAPLVQRARAS